MFVFVWAKAARNMYQNLQKLKSCVKLMFIFEEPSEMFHQI